MAGRCNRDRGKERFWRRMVRVWRRSGLSVRAFCAEHDVAEPSFYAWRRIVAERDQESARVRAKTERGSAHREVPASNDAPVFERKRGTFYLSSALREIECPLSHVRFASGERRAPARDSDLERSRHRSLSRDARRALRFNLASREPEPMQAFQGLWAWLLHHHESDAGREVGERRTTAAPTRFGMMLLWVR
jgi:transposase-like protein